MCIDGNDLSNKRKNKYIKAAPSQLWQHTTVASALGRWKQELQEPKTSYMKSYIKTKQTKPKILCLSITST